MANVALPLVASSRDVAGPRSAVVHIPSLDGLRAASFFLVFAAHAGLPDVIPGAFGVTVFFFLSGYLITTLMREEADRTGHVSLTGFYLRRALRILPPFYLVLMAATALSRAGVVGGDLQATAVASQILHVSNYWIAAHDWRGIAAGTGVYWSLAVEEHFYLVFPAVFLLLSRLSLTGRGRAVVLWGVCALVLAWRCVLVFALHAGVERVSLCSDARIDSIAFGCALALWQNQGHEKTAVRAESRPWSLALLLASVALLLVTFLVRDPAFRETFRYTLQGIALTPIFVLAVRHPGWSVFRLLNWPIMRFVGTLSYTLYLVHHVVLEAVARYSRWNPLLDALVALAVSLAIATAMHYVVEKPCARLRRRL